MPFEAVETGLDLVALEEKVLAQWDRDDVFAQSLARRAGAPEWVFYEGPPTANGRPGLHHIWARSFKDLYPRFHTMRGRFVARKGGWDCHGLPVELEIEKELGFTHKQQIEEYGIGKFNDLCRQSVHRYVEEWTTLTKRIGMWLDTESAYWTLSNDYVESVWWQLKTLWDRNLLYEGFKVVPYCGRCGTALSSHEVAQGYEDIVEPSIYVRFPLLESDADLLIWTTTPWTLLSNVAAAINPKIKYVRVKTTGRDLILAENRVTAVLGEDAQVIGEVAAAELVGAHYQRPYDVIATDDSEAFRVVAADFVTIEDGSGVVHIAPAFGDTDRTIGLAEKLPVFNPVDGEAKFDASVPDYFGEFVKDADDSIIKHLEKTGLLVRVVDYSHSYPHCWRCATPLIYRASPTWFARTSDQKQEMIKENNKIGWHPEHIRTGRFGDWLENNVDWALSRDRFWGTPLPIWRCPDCGNDQCIGSRQELSEQSGHDLSELELHRPEVDSIIIPCPSCGGKSRRIDPVLDAWFDSGAMPAAQLHYPFENKDLFEKQFPADFICEAIDQTRGWFYSLLAVNTLVFERSPYQNVVCLAHVVDSDGQKMSKSRGNAIEPWEILNAQGADSLRWYFFSAGSPWTNRRVDEKMIEEAARKFILTLWNIYSFFTTYARLDGWEPTSPTETKNQPVLDRWIKSRLNSTILNVTEALENFDALTGAQAIENFVDDLSNWYVRRSRARFWKSSDSDAHATLYQCLRTVVLLLAPFCPFVSDEIWGNLTDHQESVHLANWPEADTAAIDEDLELAMAQARLLVTLGRSARTEARIKVRQPLSRAVVFVPGGVTLSDEIEKEISDELNVKKVETIGELAGLLQYRVVPNFRLLGPRVGSLMPQVKSALNDLDGRSLAQALSDKGSYSLIIDGFEIELTADDVEIRATAHDELILVEQEGSAVAIDITINEELRLEGIARELVRAINELRRNREFELSDRIEVEIFSDGIVARAAELHKAMIAPEVLATSWNVKSIKESPSELDAFVVEGDSVLLRIVKASSTSGA